VVKGWLRGGEGVVKEWLRGGEGVVKGCLFFLAPVLTHKAILLY
jgi:hypothetical protein